MLTLCGSASMTIPSKSSIFSRCWQESCTDHCVTYQCSTECRSTPRFTLSFGRTELTSIPPWCEIGQRTLSCCRLALSDGLLPLHEMMLTCGQILAQLDIAADAQEA